MILTGCRIEQQPERMSTVSQACLEELLLYMFNHREAFHLLLLCSEGTHYSSMKEELVQLEVNATHRYYLVLEKLGTPAPQIDPPWSIFWSQADERLF